MHNRSLSRRRDHSQKSLMLRLLPAQHLNSPLQQAAILTLKPNKEAHIAFHGDEGL